MVIGVACGRGLGLATKLQDRHAACVRNECRMSSKSIRVYGLASAIGIIGYRLVNEQCSGRIPKDKSGALGRGIYHGDPI